MSSNVVVQLANGSVFIVFPLLNRAGAGKNEYQTDYQEFIYFFQTKKSLFS